MYLCDVRTGDLFVCDYESILVLDINQYIENHYELKMMVGNQIKVVVGILSPSWFVGRALIRNEIL